MKKIILLLLFNFVFADELKTLFQQIFSEIVNKEPIKVYTIPNYDSFFNDKKFLVVRSCKKADIVFGDISKCKDKPIFALSYNFYKTHTNSFGAFYYRKGRPQLKFRRVTFLKFFKKIPDDLKGFME